MKKSTMLLLVLSLFFNYAQSQIQWANKVIKARSGVGEKQFSSDQVLGKPNVYPNSGLYPTSWIPIYPDAKNNELHVAFKTPQVVKQIAVFETHAPGALAEVYLYDETGSEYLVKSFKPASVKAKSQIKHIFIDETAYKVKSVKLNFNGKAVEGYNAIDAVGISNSKVPIDFFPEVDATINKNVPSKRLDDRVNSPYSEIKPLISLDGEVMYFSRANHPGNIGGENDPEDIWYAVLDKHNDKWYKAKNVGVELNNTGPNYISGITENNAGNTMLLLGNVYSKNQKSVNEGISMTTQESDSLWSHPLEIKIQNYKNSSDIEHYYLGVNNTVLIMAVERNEGVGGTDLFISFLDTSSGHWNEPLHMGNVLNSAGDEVSPFMAVDDELTLYFSTEGRSGLGRKDIFRARRLDESWTNWSEPVNLGPGVNSEFDDLFFSMPPNADYAYFCKNDSTGKNLDIYSLYLPDFEVGPTVKLDGRLLGPNGLEMLLNTTIVFENVDDPNDKKVATLDENGEYSIKLDYGKAYKYSAVSEGVVIKEEVVDLRHITSYEEHEYEMTLTEKEVITVNEIKNKTHPDLKNSGDEVTINGDLLGPNGLELLLGTTIVFENTAKNDDKQIAEISEDGSYNVKLQKGSIYKYHIVSEGVIIKEHVVDLSNKNELDQQQLNISLNEKENKIIEEVKNGKREEITIDGKLLGPDGLALLMATTVVFENEADISDTISVPVDAYGHYRAKLVKGKRYKFKAMSEGLVIKEDVLDLMYEFEKGMKEIDMLFSELEKEEAEHIHNESNTIVIDGKFLGPDGLELLLNTTVVFEHSSSTEENVDFLVQNGQYEAVLKKDLHYAMKIKRNGETIISGDLHTHPVPVGAKRMDYTVKLSHEEVVNAQRAGILQQKEPQIKLIQKEEVYFETNQYEASSVKVVIQDLINELDIEKTYIIKVAGHTDNVGQPNFNLELSKKRAKAVVDVFTKSGVNQGVIEMNFFGETQPKVSNNSVEGRAKNRRVEIVIEVKG